jgi:hypothetical protein
MLTPLETVVEGFESCRRRSTRCSTARTSASSSSRRLARRFSGGSDPDADDADRHHLLRIRDGPASIL